MRLFWLVVVGFMHAYSTHAQPGCPEIFAGNDTVVPCTNSCIDLVAQPFRVGETTSYTVESIPYNPPSHIPLAPLFLLELMIYGVRFNRSPFPFAILETLTIRWLLAPMVF